MDSASLDCAINATRHNTIYFLKILVLEDSVSVSLQDNNFNQHPLSCSRGHIHRTFRCLPRIKMRIKLQRKTEMKIAGGNFVSLLFFQPAN